MQTLDATLFRIGDIVTRDGTDRQRIVNLSEDGTLLTVQCLVASLYGWCMAGDREDNLARRYTYPTPCIEG